MTTPSTAAQTGAGRAGAIGPFLLLYAALYGAYGSLSPFLPDLLDRRGLAPERIAAFLAAATLVRLAAAPLAGRLADRRGAARAVLATAAGLAGLAAFAHGAAYGAWPLLAVGLAYAAATAPLAPLTDALALSASAGGRGFAYGRVRGAGSLAFIAATSTVGWFVPACGPSVALACGGALFLATAAAVARVPAPPASPGPAREAEGFRQGFGAVLAVPGFPRLLLVAALVFGAHAMHDAFAMIAWRRAGIAPGVAGLLWSEAVAAEIAVFLLVGPALLARLGPAGAAALAAGAGALRWGVTAQTTALPALAAIQLLHGFTFALLHLACLRLIAGAVPARLTATALTLYGTVGQGLASAGLTLAAGMLQARFGMAAFWAMSGLSLAAVPVALTLREPSP